MTTFHLAQINIGRPLAPLDDPIMAGFVAGLAPLNALADASPGFVWRLQDEDTGDATSLRPYGDDIMLNMSVWTSIETLRDYVYHSVHLESLRRRREYFSHDGLAAYLALWWIPAGQLPTVEDGLARLRLIEEHGPGPDAFTLRQPMPPPAILAEL